MTRKFIFLINPVSGTKGKEHLYELIENRCNENSIHFEVLATSKDGDYTGLCKKIEKEFITDVIVCGGDGSVNQVASYIRRLNVNIGILPMGSGNGLAFSAGIPKDSEKAL